MNILPKQRLSPAFNQTLSRLLYLAILVTSIAISLKVHLLADLRLPPPWPDESAYLWQAINIAQHNTMFAPQLNPQRIIMWTVPGYQIFMGMVFKLAPFSLQAARAVSWVLTLISYLGLLWLFRRHFARTLVLMAASLFYLGAAFTVLGNTARMEPLLLLLAIAGFVSLDAGRPYRALALLLLCPLVHPNGAIFLVAGLAYILGKRLYRSPAPRSDRVLVALGLLAVAAYGVFAILHWQALLSDVGSQFSDKAKNYSMLVTLLKPGVLSSVVLVISVSALHVLLLRKVQPLVVLSLALLLPQLVADELFYGVYTNIAYLTALPLAMDVLAHIIRRWKPRHQVVLGSALSILLAVALLAVARHINFVESPIGYPHHVTFAGMRLSVRQSYLTPEDKAVVLQAVQTQLAGSVGRRVQFYPAADGLLFWPEQGRDFLPYQPIDSDVPPDAVVLHMSWYFPDWWQMPSWSPLAGWWYTAQDLMAEFQISNADIVRQRDQTEIWYVKRSPQR